MLTHSSQRLHPKVLARGSAPIIGLLLALGPGASYGTPTDGAVHPTAIPTTAESPDTSRAVPASVTEPAGKASEALKRAVRHTRHDRYVKARRQLGVLRRNVVRADKAGLAQIGKPPTNPESDDPPGPPSILAVLRVEHRVTADLPPLFKQRKGPIIGGLRTTLWRTHVKRDAMVRRVIALPPEGAGADYADDVADTLSAYTREVRTLTTTLRTHHLSSGSRIGLRRALNRVRGTQAKVKRAFGEERVDGLR